jgi:hypothetical protein
MDRRTAVASQLLKRAGVTGDHMSLAGSLPRETLDQFDKVMGRRDPTVPRTAGGIMSFAEGGVVGGADASVSKGFFGVGDLLKRVREEGLPANARAYIESMHAKMKGLEPPVFGADMFTDKQLERIREVIVARKEQGFEDVQNFVYPDTPAMESFRVYDAPRDGFFWHVLSDLYDPESILATSLGGFQIGEDEDNWLIDDAFDFVGEAKKGVGPILQQAKDSLAEGNTAYGVLRDIAPSLIAKQPDWTGEAQPPPPRFTFSIPKEGPVRPEAFANGGAVEPRPTDLGSEMMAIYDLLREEEDPEAREELYARLEQLQAQVGPPLSVGSDGFSVIPQFDARVSGGESNRSVPWGDDRINIADETMGGIARLGASLNFPGGNLTGGVTGVHDKTTRRFPDELQAQGAPGSVESGNRRGFVPTNYDLSGTSGRHTGTVNVQPRREGADRDAIGGRSVWDLGYAYRPSEDESFSINATPFGHRVVKNYKTGETEMDRSIRVQYNRRF